jgi:uncharacterized membrane protein YsdA (DUF1294 family)
MAAGLFLAAAVAGSFVCAQPSHHDGDNVRCANIDRAIRLQGIDAPEMPGACRPGRDCTLGDPFAARDHLRGLTRGRVVQCVAEDTDSYGRIIARCAAGGVDLSCAMIRSGHAVARYAPLDCGGSRVEAPDYLLEEAGQPGRVDRVLPPRKRFDDPAVMVPADLPARPASDSSGITPLMVLAALVAVNIATWAAFAADKARAARNRRRFHAERRVPEAALLGLAMLGGSPAGWLAMYRLRHKTAKPSFKLAMLLVTGLQFGAALGGIWWWLAG